MNLPAKIPIQATPVEYVAPANEGLDLQALIGVLMRRWRVIAAVGVFAFAAVLIVLLAQPRKYTATASIMINPRETQVVAIEQSMVQGPPSSAVVDSEIEILRSPRLAMAVAQNLHLDIDPYWGSPGEEDGVRAAARKVAGAIDVQRRALSFVIDINVTTRDPQESARIANALVEEYQRSADNVRIAATQQASNWLGQRLAELRTNVQTKEAEAEAFRASTGLLTAEGRSLTEAQTTQTQEAVLAARADLAEREARYRQVLALSRSGGVATIDQALESETIRDLRRQEAELTRRQAEYESTLGDRHPFVASGRTELRDVRQQLNAEIGRIAERAANDVGVARARVGMLERSLGASAGALVNNNADQVRLRELEREAAAARAVYESFLQRSHEITGQGRLGQTSAQLVSEAEPPNAPSSPRLLLGLVLAMLIGLIAGAVAGFAAEALDDTVKSSDDVEQRLGLPALAVVPTIDPKALRLLAPEDRHPAGYLVEKPLSPYAEAFRVMRTSLLYADVQRDAKVVAVTSALPDEGKTTCALSLARVAALGGQRVAIVDCDLRRRALNHVLNIHPRVGLIEVLSGQRAWRDVCGVDEPSGAHVIPLAETALTPRDMFSLPAMEDLLLDLREHYDLIILDCAPVLVAADARLVAGQADSAILVARWRKTRLREAEDAVRQLVPAGAKILGVAINGFDPHAPGWKPYPPYYARAYYAEAA
ncbi:MAG TPA: Wzz/FepE/Etk N-terminal domain-containing protein [Vitreimonas sp.]|jgi:succinoglycan biosynthesis transport protein ExoP|nr:Wzz/FepE/Etk N-terminal domain-containing protein [Vitreimonas sp.]